MKNKFIIIGLAMGSLAFTQDTIRCIGTTSKKVQCKIMVTNSDKCRYHGGDTTKIKYISHQCISFTNGTNVRCKLKTKHESELCHHHRPKND